MKSIIQIHHVDDRIHDTYRGVYNGGPAVMVIARSLVGRVVEVDIEVDIENDGKNVATITSMKEG